MAKKSSSDRKRKIEEVRKKQRRTEKRNTVIAVSLAVLLGGGLVAGAVSSVRTKNQTIPLNEIGPVASEAGCSDVASLPDKGAGHVGPNTDQPNVNRVDYDEAPPGSGNHFFQPMPNSPRFYSRDDAPPVERLVHNQEHGYVIAWYDTEATAAQIENLRLISRNIDRKFIVAPYTRGVFADGKHIAISAWRHSQLCDQVSGRAVQNFYNDYWAGGSKSIAPEKNAG